jgi:hypothetical protein
MVTQCATVTSVPIRIFRLSLGKVRFVSILARAPRGLNASAILPAACPVIEPWPLTPSTRPARR